MKRLVTSIVAALIVNVCLGQTPAKTIPDFTFYQLNGGLYSSKDIPFRASLFVFFDVTCGHCQLSIRVVGKNVGKFSHLTVHLISMDTREAIIKFLKHYGSELLKQSNVKVLQDVKYDFIRLFNPVKYPSIFLYDKQRKLIIYTNEDKELGSVVSHAQNLVRDK